MEAHEAVALVAGVGIASDRYATGRGHWSTWPDPSGKTLTLVAAEVLAELGMDGGDLRRNIVTEGVDLAALVGSTFHLGEAICQGVRVCLPCAYLEATTRSDLRARLAGTRGGLRADVLTGGPVALGDTVAPVRSAAPRSSTHRLHT